MSKTNGKSPSTSLSPFGTSKGNKAAPYERPPSRQMTAPVDDEAGAPKSPGGYVSGYKPQGTGASGTKIH